MEQKTSRSRRYIITKNSILMLVVLVIIFLAVWAWYFDGKKTSASTTTLSASPADGVEIAIPEKVDDGTGKLVDSFPINNDSWKTKIEFKDSGYVKNLVNDITSDGKQFVVPGFNSTEDYAIGRTVNVADVWEDGLSSKDALTDDDVNNDDKYNYISFDFYLRSRSSKINLRPESCLAAGSELGYADDGTKGTPRKLSADSSSTVPYRVSSYSANSDHPFSADAIVGAMRVSLEGAPVDGVKSGDGNVKTETTFGGKSWEKAAQTKITWLPRPDICLNATKNMTDWTLITGITPSSEYAEKTYGHSFFEGNYPVTKEDGTKDTSVKKGVTKHKYYDKNVYVSSDADENVPDYFKVSKISDSDSTKFNGATPYYPTLGQSVKIANEAENPSEIDFMPSGDDRATNGYYVYRYTLNLWIEGEDAEARRAINNGMFSLELDFGA